VKIIRECFDNHDLKFYVGTQADDTQLAAVKLFGAMRLFEVPPLKYCINSTGIYAV
jgi:hypothetical protein